MKKILRNILGRLVNLYPNHVFYANEFMNDLRFSQKPNTHRHIEGKDIHNEDCRTALLAVTVAFGRSLEIGDEMKSTFTSVTNRGENIGNFEIIIRRLENDSD